MFRHGQDPGYEQGRILASIPLGRNGCDLLQKFAIDLWCGDIVGDGIPTNEREKTDLSDQKISRLVARSGQ